MGYLVASGGEFLKSSDGSYVATVDTTLLSASGLSTTVDVGTVTTFIPTIGGTGPYTSSLVDGTLPPGMSINSAAHSITGTPTTPGAYNFDMYVEDNLGAAIVASITIYVISAAVLRSGLYKIIPGQKYDLLYTIVPSTEQAQIPNIFADSALIGDSAGENILHFNAVRIRVTGGGNLCLEFRGLDEVDAESLKQIALSLNPGQEYVVLANFKHQRAFLRVQVLDISEYFNINRVVVFVKPLWSSFPVI